jgi:dihydropteroate synthase
MKFVELIEKLKTKEKKLVMAVVNCNDDSFFAPSRARAERAVEKALKAVEDGADIIDFGGESTRPGASYISEAEELARVLPVIEAFRRESDAPISVDTRKSGVAKAALSAGADIINDISAMEDDPALAKICADYNAGIVLMHKKGVPETMQARSFYKKYKDVVSEVAAYLKNAAEQAVGAGIARDRVILDPGIGFGKNLADNLALIRRLAEIRELGYPVLVGLSRKTFVGELTGRDLDGRLAGTLASEAAALLSGADIIRAHDVKESVDLAKVISGLVSEISCNI